MEVRDMKSLKNLPVEQQLKEIDAVAARLGMPKPTERPVLEIKPGESENQKVIELKRGSWKDEHPWFVIDEEGRLLVLTSADAMLGIMNSLQHMGEEVFKARLERAIAKELPIDFHDVWTVAMHELQQRLKESGQQAASVDLDNLVKSIKRKHPNLFYSLKDLEIDEQDMKEAGL
jgi:hypothetical protein